MLTLLHHDRYLVAIDKPAGLLVHRSGLDAGETRFALQELRDQLGRPVWPVHRLDKGTSGVLLFALDPVTAATLGRRFESGEGLRKIYLAVVRGWPPDEGLVDHPLKRLVDDARAGRDEVQDARTRFRVLSRDELPLPDRHFPTTRAALAELEPLTGRRHQLRRHMKHLAHPILGDATHGKGPLNRSLAALLGTARLWLHARSLELTHPASGRPLRIEAAPGREWELWHSTPTGKCSLSRNTGIPDTGPGMAQ